ncbi:chemotaxis protein CheD [Desulfovibrio mangrovi]|uniref:chemotaxis protein CheD n=1 Tax=Desulfovibrio mangrovi TaxID=2976983 RepID=UPI002246CE21|nr:chemotaxis protein CheD [Desulfovibrio mangrovi]UZP67005.1 chemotaxis protein CheD [Desulfovibrio mangrovi]
MSRPSYRANSASIPESLRDIGYPCVHLKIGEGIVTGSNVLISTVLGSCVSVSFYCAARGMAGLFHAMLPSAVGYKGVSKSPCKFVDTAVHCIWDQFRKRGIADRDVEIKLFGGAFSMGNGAPPHVQSIVNVGGRNVDVARTVLHDLNLRISRESVGGAHGRKLVFDTTTGHIWVKKLGRTEEQALLKDERDYLPVAEGRACRFNGDR